LSPTEFSRIAYINNDIPIDFRLDYSSSLGRGVSSDPKYLFAINKLIEHLVMTLIDHNVVAQNTSITLSDQRASLLIEIRSRVLTYEFHPFANFRDLFGIEEHAQVLNDRVAEEQIISIELPINLEGTLEQQPIPLAIDTKEETLEITGRTELPPKWHTLSALHKLEILIHLNELSTMYSRDENLTGFLSSQLDQLVFSIELPFERPIALKGILQDLPEDKQLIALKRAFTFMRHGGFPATVTSNAGILNSAINTIRLQTLSLPVGK